jgi:hypothetical protein
MPLQNSDMTNLAGDDGENDNAASSTPPANICDHFFSILKVDDESLDSNYCLEATKV